MEFNPKYTITPELAAQLLEIERHREAINILPITANLITSLRETARLRSTHYSTQIEGNTLNQDEVRQIAQGMKGGFPGRERDEKEVGNYFKALEYLEGQLKSKVALSEKLVKTIHSLVLNGTLRASPYREGQNVIKDGSTGRIVYMPPEAKDVKPLMKALLNWTNAKIEENILPAPVISALLHYQVATIHPYYDGNGRTARLLTTFILHKTGYGMKGIYSLEEYYAKNLFEYYNALNVGPSHNYYEGRKGADVTPFLEYILGGMAISFRQVRSKAEELQEKEPPKLDQSDKLRNLRPQQRQVLSLYKKSKEVKVQDIAKHLGVNQRSAYGLVKKWLQLGFVLTANESKKARSYILSPEWEAIVLSRIDD
jgi:Fic family protein